MSGGRAGFLGGIGFEIAWVEICGDIDVEVEWVTVCFTAFLIARATGPTLVSTEQLITLSDATVELALDEIVSQEGIKAWILLSDFFVNSILRSLQRWMSSSVSGVGIQQSSQQSLLSTSFIWYVQMAHTESWHTEHS